MANTNTKIIHFSRGRKQNLGKVKNLTVGLPAFIELFKIPLQTPETFAEYLKMTDAQQSALKQLNGFFYRSQVTGGRRVKGAAKPADIATLDFDHATVGFLNRIKKGLILRGIKFIVHSTRRHTPESPRLRMIVFLKTPVNNDIYGAVSRILAFSIDPEMEMIDLVSFRTEQMMYMPTISSNIKYEFYESPGSKLLDWEVMLEDFSNENGDWTDLDNLPKAPGETIRNTADKAENPEDKEGPVGDFCRTWNVIEAIDYFDLPYQAVDEYSTKPRYTYTGGTTRNGAIVEDDGLFLTSYHGSDPVGGRTVNAWDLVKAHKFGDLDAQEDTDTPMGKRQSWKAMLDLVKEDKNYLRSVMQSNYDMRAIFDDLDEETLGIVHQEVGDGLDAAQPSPGRPTSDERPFTGESIADDGVLDKDALDILGVIPRDDDDFDILGLSEIPRRSETAIVRVLPPVEDGWFTKLEWSGQQILNSLPNITSILQNDLRLRGCIEYNDFRRTIVTRKALKTKLPMVPKVEIKDKVHGDMWNDTMTTYARTLLETANGKGNAGYGMRVSDRDINGAINTTAMRWRFHPIKDAIEGHVWDGIERAETLFIDFLGCPDTPYTRAVCRTWLLAAVTRIYEPGHKFDFVPILEGAQGIRKSTFIRTLSLGFAGNLTASFHDSNKLIEQITGRWIIEIPELGNMGRSVIEDAKAFFSMTETTLRLAWEKRADEYKRQCVFMGSTNKENYLTDTTGNRRFWPIKVMAEQIDTERLEAVMPQVWAEVLVMYHAAREAQPHGDLPLYLTGAEAQAEASDNQSQRQQDDDATVWAGMIEDFLNTPFKTTPESKSWLFIERTCYLQIMKEVLELRTIQQPKGLYETIKRTMGLIGWELGEKTVRLPVYGPQKAFVRKRPISAHNRAKLIREHIDRISFKSGDEDDDPESLL